MRIDASAPRPWTQHGGDAGGGGWWDASDAPQQESALSGGVSSCPTSTLIRNCSMPTREDSLLCSETWTTGASPRSTSGYDGIERSRGRHHRLSASGADAVSRRPIFGGSSASSSTARKIERDNVICYISSALDTRLHADPLVRYERDVDPTTWRSGRDSPLSPMLDDFVMRSAKAAVTGAGAAARDTATSAARCSIVVPKLNVSTAVHVAPRHRAPFSNAGAAQAATRRCAPMPCEGGSGSTLFRTARDDERDHSIARLLATVQIGRSIPSARRLQYDGGGAAVAAAAAAVGASPRCGVLYMQRRSNNSHLFEMARLRATSQPRAQPRAESRAEWSSQRKRQLGAHEARPIAALQGRSVADQIATRERAVSVLLYTVTFYANLAHSLTRSP